MSEIKRCGIYSFPKSGNTWMRQIVCGLFESTESITRIVPDVYANGVSGKPVFASSGQAWSFYKSHGAKELTNFKNEKINNDLIIYIVRNPFDVFCSQLNYLLKGLGPSGGGVQVSCESVEYAVEKGLINDFFSTFVIYGTIMPFLRDAKSWMENVQYWLLKSKSDRRIVVVKYEDIISNYKVAMAPIVERFGFAPSVLDKAMEQASSKTNDGGNFFWKKKEGTYKEYLTSVQLEKFAHFHSQALTAAGYVDYIK